MSLTIAQLCTQAEAKVADLQTMIASEKALNQTTTQQRDVAVSEVAIARATLEKIVGITINS